MASPIVAMHRFLVDFFEGGLLKYAAGQHYPVSDETKRLAALGHAEEVSVEVTPERAQKLAEKARAAADKAASAYAIAKQLEEAAIAAQRLAEEALAAEDQTNQATTGETPATTSEAPATTGAAPAATAD